VAKGEEHWARDREKYASGVLSVLDTKTKKKKTTGGSQSNSKELHSTQIPLREEKTSYSLFSKRTKNLRAKRKGVYRGRRNGKKQNNSFEEKEIPCEEGKCLAH